MPSAFPDRFILENKRVDKQGQRGYTLNIKIIKQTIPWQWKKISNLKETENDVRKNERNYCRTVKR